MADKNIDGIVESLTKQPNINDLSKQLEKEGMEPGTPLNVPPYSIYVKTPENKWKVYGGHDNGDINTVDRDAFLKKGYSDIKLVPDGEWATKFDPSGIIHDEFNPLKGYDRAVKSWSQFFNDYGKDVINPAYHGILEWLEKNKGNFIE